jgi:hypothetical protein
MSNLSIATAISAVTSVRMPASPCGAFVEGRQMAIGAAVYAVGTHTPAFLKDVVPGVRAWSPPV